MPTVSRLFATAIAAILPVLPIRAEETTPANVSTVPAEGITAEFERVQARIEAKLLSGQKTEAELAPEIAEIDAILLKYASEKTDEVATVAFRKAQIYHEVLGNTPKAISLMQEISANFPQTETAKNIAEAFEQHAAAEKRLAVGQLFPAFSEMDLEGRPLVLEENKGKIVLIVFWATWCNHSVKAMSDLIAIHDKYHTKGFEIIGISLDTDRAKLTSFLKERNIGWPQYFDGLGWRNKLSSRLNIRNTPSLFLVDRDGTILAKSLTGPALDALLAEVLK